VGEKIKMEKTGGSKKLATIIMNALRVRRIQDKELIRVLKEVLENWN